MERKPKMEGKAGNQSRSENALVKRMKVSSSDDEDEEHYSEAFMKRLQSKKPPSPKLSEDDITEMDQKYEEMDYSDDEMVFIDGTLEEEAEERALYERNPNRKVRLLDIESTPIIINQLKSYLNPQAFLLELSLKNAKIYGPECIKIATDKVFSQLRSLDLSSNPIRFIGLLHLLQEKSVLGNLRKLVLYNCLLDAEDIKRSSTQTMAFLDKRIKLTKLNHLNLSYNIIEDCGPQMFHPEFGLVQETLETLYLVQCSLADDFISQFQRSAILLPLLQDVDLSHNQFTDTFQPLMKSLYKNCKELHTLQLSNCQFGSSNQSFLLLKELSDQGFQNLKRLDLASCQLTDEQIQQLATSDYFKKVELLKLRNNKISNVGFQALLESRKLRNLKILVLAKNKISKIVGPGKDLKAFYKSEVAMRDVMKLEMLDLRDNEFKAPQIEWAKNFLSECVVLMGGNKKMQKNRLQEIMNQPVEYIHEKEAPLIRLKGPNPLVLFDTNEDQETMLTQLN